MTAHSIIDDAKDLLVMAIGEGCDLDELAKALDIIGSTAFREEFLHRLRGINDSGERGALIDQWNGLARLCRNQWDRKDFSRQTHMTLGIGGGGSAIVAALFAAVNPATLPILAFGVLAGAATAGRSFLLGRRLTDEMSILKQIGDEILSVTKESR